MALGKNAKHVHTLENVVRLCPSIRRRCGSNRWAPVHLVRHMPLVEHRACIAAGQGLGSADSGAHQRPHLLVAEGLEPSGSHRLALEEAGRLG